MPDTKASAGTPTQTKSGDSFNVDNKDLSFFKRFTLARAFVASMDVKKTGFSKYFEGHFYELADFIQPILDSQVKFDLFSQVKFDYENKIAYLYVYDALDDSKEPLMFNFHFVDIKLSKGNELQSQGAIQTYCRRYLYLTAWEITESDFGEMDPDAKRDQKKEEQEKLDKQNAENRARLSELIAQLGMTEDAFVKRHNETNPKQTINNSDQLTDQQAAGYVTLFEIKLKERQTKKEK